MFSFGLRRRTRRAEWTPLLLLPVLAGTVFGCGPSVVLPPPADLPANWNGRRLYHTPAAYIYASDPVFAREADQLVAGVSRALAERGGTPTKGLIIVTGLPDRPVVTGAGPVAFALEKETAPDRLGLPPGTATRVAWAMNLPTRSATDRATDAELVDCVRRYPTLFWYPLLVWLPYREAVALRRDLLLFDVLARQHPHWDEAERSCRRASYENAEVRRRLGTFAAPGWWL